jgi:hypothetical protein
MNEPLPNFIYNYMNCLFWFIPFSIFSRLSCPVSVLQIFFKLNRSVKIVARISVAKLSADYLYTIDP